MCIDRDDGEILIFDAGQRHRWLWCTSHELDGSEFPSTVLTSCDLPTSTSAHPVYLSMSSSSCVSMARKRHGAGSNAWPDISPKFTGVKLKVCQVHFPLSNFNTASPLSSSPSSNRRPRQRAHLAELDTLFASLQSRAFRGNL